MRNECARASIVPPSLGSSVTNSADCGRTGEHGGRDDSEDRGDECDSEWCREWLRDMAGDETGEGKYEMEDRGEVTIESCSSSNES